MDKSASNPASCYRFVVANAEDAARVIREQLGGNAQVLSVRQVPAPGVFGFLSSPRLEVIAQVGGVETPEPVAPVPAEIPMVSARPQARWSAPTAKLPDVLARAGFSPRLQQRLTELPQWNMLCGLPLHRALAETGKQLCEFAARPEREPLQRAAFFGPAGAGSTTALCKWLATDLFQRARIGHVVTAEFDRPRSAGPLPVFCEALGVPVAHFPASTEPVTPGAFVYFDLPAMSLRRPEENAAMAQFFESERITQRVLVLNAAYENSVLRQAYAMGVDLGATHVVFTHLDEVQQWARLWDLLIDGPLAPLFLATGPSLTNDLELDAADALARRTVPMSAVVEETADEPATESTLNHAA